MINITVEGDQILADGQPVAVFLPGVGATLRLNVQMQFCDEADVSEIADLNNDLRDAEAGAEWANARVEELEIENADLVKRVGFAEKELARIRSIALPFSGGIK